MASWCWLLTGDLRSSPLNLSTGLLSVLRTGQLASPGWVTQEKKNRSYDVLYDVDLEVKDSCLCNILLATSTLFRVDEKCTATWIPGYENLWGPSWMLANNRSLLTDSQLDILEWMAYFSHLQFLFIILYNIYSLKKRWGLKYIILLNTFHFHFLFDLYFFGHTPVPCGNSWARARDWTCAWKRSKPL